MYQAYHLMQKFEKKNIELPFPWSVPVFEWFQPLSCWACIYPAFANSVDPHQLASSEANWSGCALLAIKYVNLYQKLNQVIWMAEN